MNRSQTMKLMWYALFLATIVSISLFIWRQKESFLRVFDPISTGQLYSQSQYVIGELSEGGIGDDGLYSFAGYYYLFQGGDVSSVNFEHPPIGKYLIGVSILLFRNENSINLFYFAFLLFLTYFLGKELLHDRLLAMVSVFFLSLDPLLRDNLIRSLLDLPFTLFFTAAVYFFLLGSRETKYLVWSNIFWGLAFTTRFFPFLAVILVYLFLVLYKEKKAVAFSFLKGMWIIGGIYVIAHLSFFFYHPSLLEFFAHKKWMLHWFANAVILRGNIMRNVYTGTYMDSIGHIRTNEHWTPVLPIMTTISLLPMKMTSLYGFILLYTGYTVFFTSGVQKFLLPIYPIMIVLAIGNLSSIISSCRKRIFRV